LGHFSVWGLPGECEPGLVSLLKLDPAMSCLPCSNFPLHRTSPFLVGALSRFSPVFAAPCSLTQLHTEGPPGIRLPG
jgi:hypothetical protein